jgi:hypothetical protein
MRPQKSWTYAQITANAEKQIKSFHEQAKAGPETDWSWHHTAAYGVFNGWYSLCCGWMENGDRERIEALVDAIPYRRPSQEPAA